MTANLVLLFGLVVYPLTLFIGTGALNSMEALRKFNINGKKHVGIA